MGRPLVRIMKIMDATSAEERAAIMACLHALYPVAASKVMPPREHEARRKRLQRDQALRAYLIAEADNRCTYCGIPVRWDNRLGPDGATIDHIDPDGGDGWDNLTLACRGCNARKNNQGPGALPEQPPLPSDMSHGPPSDRRPSDTPPDTSHGAPVVVVSEVVASPVVAVQKPPSIREDAREVLHFLNERTSRNYRAVDTNLKLIEARLRSGLSVETLKKVVEFKCQQWLGDPKMEQFLRPETLFGATKCEQYVGEATGSGNGVGVVSDLTRNNLLAVKAFVERRTS